MGTTINAANGNMVRVGRKLQDVRGNIWTVVRLYLDKGEAMIADPVRKIVKPFHPVHDAGEMIIVG